MFEDSLVESAGQIRTRSRRYAFGSFLLEAALVAILILIPYLYPAALPRTFLSVPLLAPPPAAPQMAGQHATAAFTRHALTINLTARPRIPTGILQINYAAPPGYVVGSGARPGMGDGPSGALFPGVSPAPAPEVRLAKPTGPVRISAGIAAGQLIVPIQPVYPAIARSVGVQGTVVVAATISTEGRIENPQVVSGPPMLVRVAVDAILQARYRPYMLNGSPVEVETTISVVFRLGDG